MRRWKMSFTKENHEANQKEIKTMTRRVIEKIDHYKKMNPGDIICSVKNRFTKIENHLYQLECVNTWTENLQEITIQDILNEGIDYIVNNAADEINARHLFILLWNRINIERGYGWDKNPRVRAIEYKLIKQGGDE
jgi:hypothetical protein